MLAKSLQAPDLVPASQGLEIRLADQTDRPPISQLMELAIRQLQKPFLDARQIEASFDVMGLDGQLIEDRTYYVAAAGEDIIGCGGWSRRSTLYGGSHTTGRNAALLDPARDAVRIRAMYTHPAHARRGVGRLILETCEAAARAEGFRQAELMATLAGKPLYEACGYRVVEESSIPTASGLAIPGRKMMKAI